jgi:hypothetical protein
VEIDADVHGTLDAGSTRRGGGSGRNYTTLRDLADRWQIYITSDAANHDAVNKDLIDFIRRSGLDDVRNEPMKAMELLKVAERFRLPGLRTEAFVHCAGMWVSYFFFVLPSVHITILGRARLCGNPRPCPSTAGYSNELFLQISV